MAATKSHVIELSSPAFIRPRYIRRENRDGGFVVTTNCARARRYAPTAAAQALRTFQRAIEQGGFTPCVVPAAAVDGGQS